MYSRARDTLASLLAPESYDRFFDEVVGHRMAHIHEGDLDGRARLIGDDPKATILAAYDDLAQTLTCHSGSAKRPPPMPRRVDGPSGFEALVREYHEAEYTVRIPDVTGLSAKLRRLSRAIEEIFENPAGPSIFWSAAGADAPVHHDEVDLFIVQLTGRKRWYISSDPPTLPNSWKTAGEGAPPLEHHHVLDVVPGDVLYLPRGTAHTVESTTESIHVSIGVVPVTVREAINAAADYLSELSRDLRAGITARADDLARGEGSEAAAARVRQGLRDLLSKCESDDFVREALSRRRGRMIEDLPKIQGNGTALRVQPDTLFKHHPLAFAQVLATGNTVDFRQPGERILVHRGAEDALRYIASTPEFRVADIPGGLGEEVKVALVTKLISTGFLVPERSGRA